MFFKTVNILRNCWKNDRSLFLVLIGIFGYTNFFTSVSFLRYDSFSYNDFDFAMYIHETWKIAHGSSTNSMFMDSPICGIYLALISYLIAPFFALFQFHPKSLLVLQALILGMGALPIYLIARAKISPWAAMFLAFAYLLYPPLWFTNLCEYYPKTFSTLTLLFMFYFMDTKKFRGFIICLLLTLLLRVDLAMTTFMFGVYALWERKEWKWVLAPSLISSIWVFLGLFVIIPKFQGHLNMYEVTFSYLGNNFPEIVHTIIKNPDIWMKVVFHKSSLEFIFQILLPMLFLPLVAFKELLLCLPSLFHHLLSPRAPEHSILFHYTSTITPFVFIATAYALNMLFKLKHLQIILCGFILSMTIFCNFYFNNFTDGANYWDDIVVDDMDKYSEYLLRKIPPDAGVISTFKFSPRLAGRKSYYSMHYIYGGVFYDGSRYLTPEDAKYALIDFRDKRMLSFTRSNSDVNLRQFLGKDWDLIDYMGSICLFERRSPVVRRPYEVFQHSDDQAKPNAAAYFGEGIALTRFSANFQKQQDFRVIHLIYGLHLLKKTSLDLGVFVQLIDENGKIVFTNYKKLCYGIYPSWRWSKGEEVVDLYNLLIPAQIPAGRYQLSMSLLDSTQRVTLPVSYPSKKDKGQHKYYLSSITID